MPNPVPPLFRKVEARFANDRTEWVYVGLAIVFVLFSRGSLEFALNDFRSESLARFAMETSVAIEEGKTYREIADSFFFKYADFEEFFAFGLFDPQLEPSGFSPRPPSLPERFTRENLNPGLNAFGTNPVWNSPPLLLSKRLSVKGRELYLIVVKVGDRFDSLAFTANVFLLLWLAFLPLAFHRFSTSLNSRSENLEKDAKTTTRAPSSRALRELCDPCDVLGSLREGVLLVGAKMEVLYLNRAARKLLGLEYADAPPFNLEESVRNIKLLETLRSCLQTRRETEKTLETLDESKKFLSVAIRFVGSVPAQKKLLVSVRNVTGEKNATASQRDFAVNVSHELKTPIANILGYSETLVEKRTLTEKQRTGMLEVICEQSLLMNSIVDNLLLVSKYENQTEPLPNDPKTIRLSDLLQNLVKIYREKIAEKELELTVEKGKDATFKVREELLFTCLSNLLDNAVKFSRPKGNIKIRGTLEKATLRISVEDEGLGISAQDLPYVFDKFYRGRNVAAAGSKGSGLGLSLVKRFVELMRGSIEVKTDLGEGTVFSLRVPTEAAEEA